MYQKWFATTFAQRVVVGGRLDKLVGRNSDSEFRVNQLKSPLSAEKIVWIYKLRHFSFCFNQAEVFNTPIYE